MVMVVLIEVVEVMTMVIGMIEQRETGVLTGGTEEEFFFF